MSFIGDPGDWDTFFEKSLVPAILAHVLATWDRLERPVQDERESNISRCLYSALVNAKDRSQHPFRISYEDVEVDTDLAKVTGRKDIVFHPSTEETIYFCLECKRLNVESAGKLKSLADEYVKNGMQRFVTGQYAQAVRHGGMLGYVLDGDVQRAMSNVENCIRLHSEALGINDKDAPGCLQRSSICPDDPAVRETSHQRRHESMPFRIHHLFLASPVVQRAGSIDGDSTT